MKQKKSKGFLSAQKSRRFLTCPKCGSEDIKLDAGGQTGKYRCAKCGYIGVLVIEEND